MQSKTIGGSLYVLIAATWIGAVYWMWHDHLIPTVVAFSFVFFGLIIGVWVLFTVVGSILYIVSRPIVLILWIADRISKGRSRTKAEVMR